MKKVDGQKVVNITATVVIFAIFAVLMAIPMRISILRFASATKDAGIQIGNQFIRFIDKNKLLPDTVKKIPDYKKYLCKKDKKGNDLNKDVSREDQNQLQKDNKKYWSNFAKKENIEAYTFKWLMGIIYFLQALMVLVVVVMLLKILLREYFKREKVAPYKKTKALEGYIKVERKAINPTIAAIKGYIDFVLGNKWIKGSYLLLFLFTSNAMTIIVEAIAVYFYILRTMDIKAIPYQIYKLGYDLKIYFKSVSIIIHIGLGILIFNAVRKKIGIRRLNIYEVRNAGLVEALPICTMLVGTMGTKKTTILTDMALTQTNTFKNKALNEMLEIRKQFPAFNFSKLDAFLRICIMHHQVYSLKTVDKLFDKKMYRCMKQNTLSMFKERLEDYARWSDGLSLADVINTFRTYSKLFLIYFLNSALIYSNYSIRYDFGYSDIGNFPLYYCDYFNTQPYDAVSDECSTYSHILDFDMLRLGKKLIEDTETSKVYDFGFFALTEIGKERGNQLTTQGMKRTDEEPNQKNDYFNAFIKLIRHTSTINNYPYCKFLADEQRPESLEADLRELFDIVRIKRSDKYKCTFPLYFERPFLEWFNEIYDKYNLERIFYRSNDSLKYYLARKFVSWMYGINTRILNKYGVYKCDLETTSSGTIETKQLTYYLMKKKIYSNRFKTDAYNSFFKASRSEKIGIGDIYQYHSTQATKGELMAQNSYFINDLQKYNKPKEDNQHEEQNK